MRRLLIAGVILSITAGCYRFPCYMWAPDDSGTKVTEFFSSPEAGFKIGLPTRDPAAPAPQKDADGAVRFKWLVLNHGQYEVSYYELQNDVEATGASSAMFDKLRDIYLAKRPGHLELEKDLKLSGHPGRELRIRDDAGLDIKRLYAVKSRLYIVSAFVPRRLDCAIDRVLKVLDTFEFTGENAAA